MLIRLMATELIIQKELDPYPKEIQQIGSDKQLKILYNVIVANESTFVLTILEKKNKIKIFSRKCSRNSINNKSYNLPR